MKTFILTLIIMIIGCWWMACKDEIEHIYKPIDTNHDFIVFGSVGAFCNGDCRELFMVTEENLYKDANKITALRETEFAYEPLSTENFLVARDLLIIPDHFINNPFVPGHLLQKIEDFDYYIYGQVDKMSFEIIFDEIDSSANPDLHRYANLMHAVVDQIR